MHDTKQREIYDQQRNPNHINWSNIMMQRGGSSNSHFILPKLRKSIILSNSIYKY